MQDSDYSDALVEAVINEDYDTLDNFLYLNYLPTRNLRPIGLLPIAAKHGKRDVFEHLLNAVETTFRYDDLDDLYEGITIDTLMIDVNHESEQLWQVFDGKGNYLVFVQILLRTNRLCPKNIQSLFDAAVRHDYQDIVKFFSKR